MYLFVYFFFVVSFLLNPNGWMGKYEQGNIDVLFTITLLCDDRVIPLLLQQVPSFYKYYMDEGCA